MQAGVANIVVLVVEGVDVEFQKVFDHSNELLRAPGVFEQQED